MSSKTTKISKIGLTGGIGGGKTIVSQIFSTLGIPVYNSDLRAREITDENPELISKIKQHFGNRIYDDTNRLVRKAMSDIVFNDPAKLSLLNSLVHPAVAGDFQRWYEQQQSPYILKESAIIFETGLNKNLDSVICVFCPEEIRLKRLLKREGITEKKIKEIMKNQWPDEQKMEASDFVIINDENQSVIKQVTALHKIFTKS